METQAPTRSMQYARAIVRVVAHLPAERAAEVYDFACFLQTRSGPGQGADEVCMDWLHDSEEQMQAEDALWEAACDRHQDAFSALAEAARAEMKAGTTRPMFNEQGEWMTDEVSHDS